MPPTSNAGRRTTGAGRCRPTSGEAGGGRASGRAQQRTGRGVGRAHRRGAAPPRQLGPGRLPFGGAVHPAAGRAAEAGVWLRQPSPPWFITACFLALFGGPHGRRAALTGLAAIGASSLVVNQPMKLIGERHRPDRNGLGVPQQRWVRMPSSTSFPPATRRPPPRCRWRGEMPPAQASVAWRSVGRGVFPRVHGRALPERRSRSRS